MLLAITNICKHIKQKFLKQWWRLEITTLENGILNILKKKFRFATLIHPKSHISFWIKNWRGKYDHARKFN